MNALLILLIATTASFIGSLQAGLVNTAVLTTTLREGRAAGRRMAWGGAVPLFQRTTSRNTAVRSVVRMRTL